MTQIHVTRPAAQRSSSSERNIYKEGKHAKGGGATSTDRHLDHQMPLRAQTKDINQQGTGRNRGDRGDRGTSKEVCLTVNDDWTSLHVAMVTAAGLFLR